MASTLLARRSLPAIARLAVLGLSTFWATLAACSANAGGPTRSGPGADGAGSAGAAAGSGGTTGQETGGTSTGGMLNLDAALGDGALAPDGACESVTQAAETLRQPADIVWAIDTSCSMATETFAVQQNINAFSHMIAASGIDVRVVMLAEASIFVGFQGICVAPPLGSGACPADTNLPRYWHHPTAEVNSNDGLKVLMETFPSWSFMLRPEATKTLVIVTDDDALEPGFDDARKFIDEFTALDPILQQPDGSPAWKMSGIYSFSACPEAANAGVVWKDVVDQTGGIHGDLCLQNFPPVLHDLASAIVTGSTPIACEWGIPDPGEGKTLDPGRVNVRFGKDGLAETIYNVADQADCDASLGGWYYDDPTAPTRVVACDATCDEVSTTENGVIEILFGCQTEQIPK